jgi:hypothetical protein
VRIRVAVAAVAVLSVLGSTACGADRPSSAQPTRSPSGPAFPQVTVAQAKQQLTAFVAANSRANTHLDEKVLAQIETGSALVVDRADFRARKSIKASPYPAADMVDVTVYPPRLGTYPRWFLTRGHWKDAGKAADKTWKYELIEQQKAGGPWLEMAGPNEYAVSTVPQPQIKTDADGLATQVPADATGLLLAPRDVAAYYAADLMDKPFPYPDAQFALDPDGWLGQAAENRQNMSDSATVTDTAAPATQYPTYAVRTLDGGALVDTTVTFNERYDVYPGHWVDNTDGDGFLPKGHHYTHHMEQDRLVNVLVYVPPANSTDKLRVVANYAGVIKVDAS